MNEYKLSLDEFGENTTHRPPKDIDCKSAESEMKQCKTIVNELTHLGYAALYPKEYGLQSKPKSKARALRHGSNAKSSRKEDPFKNTLFLEWTTMETIKPKLVALVTALKESQSRAHLIEWRVYLEIKIGEKRKELEDNGNRADNVFEKYMDASKLGNCDSSNNTVAFGRYKHGIMNKLKKQHEVMRSVSHRIAMECDKLIEDKERVVSILDEMDSMIEDVNDYIHGVNTYFNDAWNTFEQKWSDWNIVDIISWLKYKSYGMEKKFVDWYHAEYVLRMNRINGKSLDIINLKLLAGFGLQQCASYLYISLKDLMDKCGHIQITESKYDDEDEVESIPPPFPFPHPLFDPIRVNKALVYDVQNNDENELECKGDEENGLKSSTSSCGYDSYDYYNDGNIDRLHDELNGLFGEVSHTINVNEEWISPRRHGWIRKQIEYPQQSNIVVTNMGLVKFEQI